MVIFTACKNTDEYQHPAYSNPAIISYTDAINNAPKNAALYFNRAEALMQIEMDSLSIIDMQKAIELDPDNVEYQYTLAVLYMYNEQSDKAAPIFEQIIDEYKDHLSAHLFLARAYLELENTKGLEKTFERINKIGDTHPEVDYLKSEWALLSKDTNQAIAFLDTLTEKYPEYYKAWMLLASLKSNQNDEQFIHFYERAFNLDTLDVQPYFEIGKWYEAQENEDEAISYYEKCIQKDFDFTPAYMSLGKIYLSRDSFEKAYRHFNMASQTKINFGEAYYYQSITLEKAGEIEAAKGTIRQALIYDKNNELYQKQWDKLFN